MFVVAMAFALLFFVAAPKGLFAHSAAPSTLNPLSIQEPQSDSSSTEAEDKAGSEDINDDHQEATDDDKDMDTDKTEDENEAKETAVEAAEVETADDDVNSVEHDRAEDEQHDAADSDPSGVL
jgi:hypothetical protein